MGENVILNKLKELSDRKVISFHVPGHKVGKRLKELKAYYSSEMFSLDTTELSDTDNLHAPKDIIKRAQEKAAKVFKADSTFFLVNGTTCGNISALMAVLNPGDKVIVPRDCHKSVIYGLVMGGYRPIYINPEISNEWGVPAGIKPDAVEKSILEHADAKAVVMTYPNYYGICSDIEAIAKIVKKYNKILIVDEAHGSHFMLNDLLPISSLQGGADIVIQSTHKTLPALTQASMLHVKSDKVDIERLKTMLQMNQSSSPSYLLLASLDMAIGIVEDHGIKLMDKLLTTIDSFESEIQKYKGVKVLDEKIIGKDGVKDKDKTRLVISMTEVGLTGIELSQILSNDYNIQMEMAEINNVVAVATIGNHMEDFEALERALYDISKGREKKAENTDVTSFSYGVPKVSITPREACFLSKEKVGFRESLGKLSGEYIIPYPPGIPILCPGEVITKEVMEYVYKLKEQGGEIIGMEDESLKEIKIIKNTN